jgi:hypothetical protein
MAPLGDTASADKARLLSARGRALSASGDYPTAVATFDQARALAEQVGNERALADVLHMQTAPISATPSLPMEFASACRQPRRSSKRVRCGISAACRRS